jgi:hypothetical protein
MKKCEINAEAADKKLLSISWMDDDSGECSITMDSKNRFALEMGSLRIGIPTDKMRELAQTLAHYKGW